MSPNVSSVFLPGRKVMSNIFLCYASMWFLNFLRKWNIWKILWWPRLDDKLCAVHYNRPHPPHRPTSLCPSPSFLYTQNQDGTHPTHFWFSVFVPLASSSDTQTPSPFQGPSTEQTSLSIFHLRRCSYLFSNPSTWNPFFCSAFYFKQLFVWVLLSSTNLVNSRNSLICVWTYSPCPPQPMAPSIVYIISMPQGFTELIWNYSLEIKKFSFLLLVWSLCF